MRGSGRPPRAERFGPMTRLAILLSLTLMISACGDSGGNGGDGGTAGTGGSGAVGGDGGTGGTGGSGGSGGVGGTGGSDLCDGVDCDDVNECTSDACVDDLCENTDLADGEPCKNGLGSCTSGECVDFCDGLANGTECADGEGSCQNGICVPNPAETTEFLAVDCTLVGNSAAIPMDSQAEAATFLVQGEAVNVQPQATIVLPATLVCGFVDAGFNSVEVANSDIEYRIAGATPTSAPTASFLNDGTPNRPQSPHDDVFVAFDTACGTPAGSGPGIVVPFLPPTDTPVDAGAVEITPAAVSNVAFAVEYAGLALELKNLMGAFGIPSLCLGGSCEFDACTPEDRDGDGLPTIAMPDAGGPNDSPRIMYDATCNKAQAEAGDCVPFEEFTDITDVCAGRAPNDPPVSCDPSDQAECCAVLQTKYPTATNAQQAQLPVAPAP